MKNLFIAKVNYLFIFLVGGIVSSCVPIAQQNQTTASLPQSDNSGNTKAQVANVPYYIDKTLRTENFNYETTIRTVELYPQLSEQTTEATLHSPAVVPLTEQTLMLEFDELTSQSHTPFHARVYHCNADWTISTLNDIEFMQDFNDFIINRSEYSAATKVPYIHYKFELPKVKISGNYIIMVHREGNIKDILLTRRFVVFENLVEIGAGVVPSSGIKERRTNQQIDFGISYKNYNLYNPRENVKVTIRQNGNWLNATQKLAPFSIKEDLRILEYNFFNLENNFPAGNEFRFFDIRSLKFIGQNVAKLEVAEADKNVVFLGTDQSRANKSYTLVKDQNGEFVIDNYERGNGAIQADYANVRFFLKTPEVPDAKIYIFGALTNWQLGNESMMHYDTENQGYRGELLLKQGYYNFRYVLLKNDKPDESYFEGSYFETENRYEIFVYYRPVGVRNDLVVGFKTVFANSRN
jgi:hypothetical protein